MGCNKKMVDNHIYQNFTEKKPCDITLAGILVCPGEIACAVVFPKEESANKFPHMTLMLGSKQAKFSNDLMNLCFGDETSDQGFKEQYEKMRSGKVNQMTVRQIQVQIKEKKKKG